MIYFDNAATTFPKPQRVGRHMKVFLERSCANPGRGGHKLSRIAGKKVLNAGYQAVIGQLGNSRLERQLEVASKGVGYLLLGIAAGPSAPLVVGGAILAEVATNAIQSAVETHNVQLQNERLQITRGGLRKNLGGYYD